MFRAWGLVILVIFAVTAASAQSGRRATALPTPVTEKKGDDPGEYSESKPRSSRTSATVDRFPNQSIATGKKSAPAPAPTPANTVDTATVEDPETLRIETNLVTIPVSIFDRNGLYIPGLRKTDFKIFQDGVEQEIEYFGTSDKPFTVALVLDVSPSTEYKIDQIRAGAKAFVDQLSAQDSVIVIDFDHGVRVRTEATRDRAKIFKAIDKADFGDGTSLYNAVDEALRKQLGKIAGRKAVVLFTDGVDTTSRKNSYESTLNYAEESDSLVFPIYFNTYYDMAGGSGGGLGGINGGQIPGGGGILGGILGTGGPMMGSAEMYATGRRYLNELAEVTGGRVFRPEATPGGLTAAFEGIAEELRRQYNIGFIPSEEGKVGQVKSIKVRVNRPNLIIRARDSYVVGNAMGSPTMVDKSKK